MLYTCVIMFRFLLSTALIIWAEFMSPRFCTNFVLTYKNSTQHNKLYYCKRLEMVNNKQFNYIISRVSSTSVEF
jgi:hypothetical protein